MFSTTPKPVTASTGQSLAGYATVVVRLLDRNDNPPRLTVNTYRTPSDVATVPESADPGAFVAHVSATDVDEGPNGKVDCRLADSEAENYFRLERIGTTTTKGAKGVHTEDKVEGVEYKLATRVKLDREERVRHLVGIVCRDFRGTPV